MRVIDEYKLYLAIASLLVTLASAVLLFNDLMKRRTYIFRRLKRRRRLITRDNQPALYWVTLGVPATSTLIVFACSLILLIEAITGENIIEFWGSSVPKWLVGVSGGFIIQYLVYGILARLNTFQAGGLIDLGLSREMNKNQDVEQQQ